MDGGKFSEAPKSWISRHSVLLIFVTFGVLVALLTSTPLSFLSYSTVDYQTHSFFDSPEGDEYKSTPSGIRDDNHSSPTGDKYKFTSSGIRDDNHSSAAESPQSVGLRKPVKNVPAPSPQPVGNGIVPSLVSVNESPVPSPEPNGPALSPDFVMDAPAFSSPASSPGPVNNSAAPSPFAGEEELKKSNDTSEIVEDANILIVADDDRDDHGERNDSQQAAEGPSAIKQEKEDEEDVEKFIVPQLSYQVGTGNQLMEYKSAAVIARTLNRTLCLVPFFIGPTRHFGHLGDKSSGLYFEDRYDTDILSRFVKIASLDECVQKCNSRLDAHWQLKVSRPPKWGKWFNDTPRFAASFQGKAQKWTSIGDIAETLGPRNQGPKCAGLGGLFPGLRWRGVFFATSAYLQHSKVIMKAADLLEVRAFGTNSQPYLSVHWRFEESNCRGHSKGLCFTRCSTGKVIANGRPSLWWPNMTIEGPKVGTKDGFNAVFVSMSDISGAIFDYTTSNGLSAVYLSTDGWISNRGPESKTIVKWVVNDLRGRGIKVAGLWQILDLPNFDDDDGASFVHKSTLQNLLGLNETDAVSDHMVALLEQEMCGRSAVFLGSGQSTWSMAVADTRRGRRWKLELESEFMEDADKIAMEQTVIDRLLTAQFIAGPTCRGSYNPVPQTPEDEEPDSWLDYAACEERLDKGIGQCTRIRT